MQEKIWYLKKITLFKNMSSEEMKVLDEMTIDKTYKRKSKIFLQGDAGSTIYMLKSGMVKISTFSEEGKVFTLGIVEPGEIFGELALADDAYRDTIAEAHDDCYICAINKNDFEGLIMKQPNLALSITKLICFRRKVIENSIKNLIFNDSRAKIISLISMLQGKFGKDHKGGVIIDIKLTHQEIADLTGLSRETATNNINELKEDGFIDVIGKKIIVKDEFANLDISV